MNPRDYSDRDLTLYYQDSFVYSRKNSTVIRVSSFHTDMDDRKYTRDSSNNIHHIEDLDDEPKISVLANGKASAYFLLKDSKRQFRKGVTVDNTKLKYVYVWGGEHKNSILQGQNFKTLVKPFYEEIKYPSPEGAVNMLRKKLSAAFSPKFALAIPPFGRDPLVMRMNHIIGRFRDGVVFLNPRVKHYKEELEQYVEVQV